MKAEHLNLIRKFSKDKIHLALELGATLMLFLFMFLPLFIYFIYFSLYHVIGCHIIFVTLFNAIVIHNVRQASSLRNLSRINLGVTFRYTHKSLSHAPRWIYVQIYSRASRLPIVRVIYSLIFLFVPFFFFSTKRWNLSTLHYSLSQLIGITVYTSHRYYLNNS